MEDERFAASTQYDDMQGTACADNHDSNPVSGFLKRKEIDTGVIIGIKMYSGEVHGKTQDKKVNVSIDIADGIDVDEATRIVGSGERLQVNRIKTMMTLNEFFGFFKRFSICISIHGLINEKQIDIVKETDVE